MLAPSRWFKAFGVSLAVLCAGALPACAQDRIRTETTNGAASVRLAVADFKPSAPDSGLLTSTFDTVFFADLSAAGIFDMISKNMLPPTSPANPAELNLKQWSLAPVQAAYAIIGSISVNSGKMVVRGWLADVNNLQYPVVLSKQYSEDATQDAARQIAHRFADEIILRLGGGVPGIAETKIVYIHRSGVTKEVWIMDYDGANQHPVTHLGTISLSPRISPDGTRIAFSSIDKGGWGIRMYSLVLGRIVSFHNPGGTNLSPAWSSTGTNLAFSSSESGDPEIWVTDANGNSPHRITSARGPDVSPVWNPRTNAQIAWVSGRSGLPRLYVMDADGTGVSQLTSYGYATSPSWSPNGQFLAFAWNRKYGPGAPGGQDIYVQEVVKGPEGEVTSIQLTHDSGRCDFPSWSPDGRHIVYSSTVGGKSEIWTMLADGTQKRRLTMNGGNDMPNWSWK